MDVVVQIHAPEMGFKKSLNFRNYYLCQTVTFLCCPESESLALFASVSLAAEIGE